MSGDGQLSLCYFKNRIIEVIASSEFEEYGKKKIPNKTNKELFPKKKYSIFGTHNQDFKKKIICIFNT